jgi:hypothetical protein
MKKIPFEEIIKNAGQEVTLSSDERARMLSTLREHVASNPIQEVAPRLAAYQAMFDAFIGYARRPAFALATLVLVVVVSGGAFAYAAQGTLPGDPLYALKVDVTEPLLTALTFSTADKIAWQQTLAERRLNEGLSLANEGKLATTTEVALATDFSEHADAAETLSESDSDSQPTDATPNDFVPQLSTYQEVFATQAQSNHGRNSTDVLRSVVDIRIALLASSTQLRSASPAHLPGHGFNPHTASTSTASTSTSVSVHTTTTPPHSATASTTTHTAGTHSSATSTTTTTTSTSTSVTATTTTITTSIPPVVVPPIVPTPPLPIKL